MSVYNDPEKPEDWIYARARTKGAPPRYYGDFRQYKEFGGGQEPLKAPGDRFATTDRAVAVEIAAARLEHLRLIASVAGPLGAPGSRGIAAFAAQHLRRKKAEGKTSAQWLAAEAVHLERFADHFGDDRDIGTILPADLDAWAVSLGGMANGRGGTLGDGSVRQHLNSVSRGIGNPTAVNRSAPSLSVRGWDGQGARVRDRGGRISARGWPCRVLPWLGSLACMDRRVE